MLGRIWKVIVHSNNANRCFLYLPVSPTSQGLNISGYGSNQDCEGEKRKEEEEETSFNIINCS